jgi:predicted branched-subunit amino acid permease
VKLIFGSVPLIDLPDRCRSGSVRRQSDRAAAIRQVNAVTGQMVFDLLKERRRAVSSNIAKRFPCAAIRLYDADSPLLPGDRTGPADPRMTSEHIEDFGPARAARRHGMLTALGMPGLVLGASYLGFGALVRESHLTMVAGLTSTTAGWALPGQIVLVETYAVGGSLLTATLAILLTNARLLPMVASLMPILRASEAGPPRLRHYLIAHLIAITGFAIAMQRAPRMVTTQRLPFYEGFAITLWSITILMTAAGFGLAGWVPRPVTLGFVFLNPLYFMLVFLSDLKHRLRARALIIGAVLGPSLYLASAEWGLLATGLIAGSIAFLIDGWQRRRQQGWRR